MTIRFSRFPGPAFLGTLSYEAADHAYWFEPATPTALAGSLVAQFLEFYIPADTLKIAWVAGRSVQTSWRQHVLGEPPTGEGAVLVNIDSERLLPGVAIELADTRNWVSLVDRESGWFRCGANEQSDEADFVTIATGTVLELEGDRLNGVWLQPSGEWPPAIP